MSLLQELRTERIRCLKTVVLLMCWLSLGMSLGVVGPTLLDLQQQVHVTTDAISFALSARAGGYAMGSFLSELIDLFSCYLNF